MPKSKRGGLTAGRSDSQQHVDFCPLLLS